MRVYNEYRRIIMTKRKEEYNVVTLYTYMEVLMLRYGTAE